MKSTGTLTPNRRLEAEVKPCVPPTAQGSLRAGRVLKVSRKNPTATLRKSCTLTEHQDTSEDMRAEAASPQKTVALVPAALRAAAWVPWKNRGSACTSGAGRLPLSRPIVPVSHQRSPTQTCQVHAALRFICPVGLLRGVGRFFAWKLIEVSALEAAGRAGTASSAGTPAVVPGPTAVPAVWGGESLHHRTGGPEGFLPTRCTK